MKPFKNFNKTQRFRVIVNGISFYTDADQIRNGVGDFTKLNQTVREALVALEDIIKTTGPAYGLTFDRHGYSIQLSMV
jgi:hypothetical protein